MKRKQAMLAMAAFLLITKESGRAFGLDGLDGHWAANYMNTLAAKGVLSGYPDQKLRPDDPVTRAELCHALVIDLRLPVDYSKTFQDTGGHWAHDSISTAYQNDLMSGYGNDQFVPDGFLTREEACAVISRCIRDEEIAEGDSSIDFRFVDGRTVSEWAAADVGKLLRLKIVHGYPDGFFRPRKLVTRAEAFKMITAMDQMALTPWLQSAKKAGAVTDGEEEETAKEVGAKEAEAEGAEPEKNHEREHSDDQSIGSLWMPLEEQEIEEDKAADITADNVSTSKYDARGHTPMAADAEETPEVILTARMGSLFRTIDADITTRAGDSVYYVGRERGGPAPTAEEIVALCRDADAKVVKGRLGFRGDEAKKRLTLTGGENVDGSETWKDGYRYDLYMVAMDSRGGLSGVTAAKDVMALPFAARSADGKTFTIREITPDEIAAQYPDLAAGEADGKSHTAIQLENIRRMAELHRETNGQHGDPSFLTSRAYTYVLGGDIDLSGYAASGSGMGWRPIGTKGEAFGGSFDGQNYRVMFMQIKQAGKAGDDMEDAYGLFGRTEGAVLRNVQLESPVVSVTKQQSDGSLYVGGLIGCASRTIIEQVVVNTPRITGYAYGSDKASVGGMVGYAQDTDISHASVSHADVTAYDETAPVNRGRYAGGLVGRFVNAGAGPRLFHDLTVSGVVRTRADAAGGLAGSIESLSEVESRIHCYNLDASADVSGGRHAGGVAGVLGLDEPVSLLSKITFDNAMASGRIQGLDTVGGLFGRINAAAKDGVVVKNSDSMAEVSGEGIDGLIGGFVGEVNCGSFESNASGGATLLSPASAAGGFVGKTTEDADFINCIAAKTVETNGISGGFAGLVERRAYFQDCGVEDGLVSTGVDDAGGFVGLQRNGPAIFYNCYSLANVKASGQAGGFGGQMGEDVEVDRCRAAGNVDTQSTGGGFVAALVGRGSVSRCHATGDLTGSGLKGGFAGIVAGADSETADYPLRLLQCYAEGDVATAYGVAGGFVGRLRHALVEQCLSEGYVKKTGNEENTGGFCGEAAAAEIVNCCATGDVYANSSYNGGFAGLAMDGVKIRHSYSRGDVTGLSGTGGFVGEGGQGSELVGCLTFAENIINTRDLKHTNRFSGAMNDASVISCFGKESAVVRIMRETKLIRADAFGNDGGDLTTDMTEHILHDLGWDGRVWDFDTVSGANGKESLGRPVLRHIGR